MLKEGNVNRFEHRWSLANGILYNLIVGYDLADIHMSMSKPFDGVRNKRNMLAFYENVVSVSPRKMQCCFYTTYVR